MRESGSHEGRVTVGRVTVCTNALLELDTLPLLKTLCITPFLALQIHDPTLPLQDVRSQATLPWQPLPRRIEPSSYAQ